MKFSENWIREWVDPPINSSEMAHRLTMAGHEVDQVLSEGECLDGVIVAEVASCERHPNADKLSLCQVATGSGDLVNVVCGAPNVHKGMKTAFAGPGVKLPNGLKLRRTKIRGIESNGMLCSSSELGLGVESDGIIQLPLDSEVGQPLGQLLSLPDTIFDVNLTPNRGDCFSVAGIARDLSAITATPLKPAEWPKVIQSINNEHAVQIESAASCPRFVGRVIRGIFVNAKSPLWMTEKLRRAGLRSIHPVVDITNYVMLELGQPLHAYDLAKLDGAIRPRFATTGEKLVLLDGREIELHTDTLVISDDSGAIGLAGIMGGLTTAVSAQTTDVFLEAAFWPQSVIAGRARLYGLHTDASLRFERGVDPSLQAQAVERATQLLLEVAGGKAGPMNDVVDKKYIPRPPDIRLRDSQIERLLGIEISRERVGEIFRLLDIDAVREPQGWQVTVPSYRFDLSIEHDLIEEVARIFGYDRIEEKTEIVQMPLAAVTEFRVDLDLVANTLVARDYQEVVTYSFVEPALDSLVTGQSSALGLQNPISSEMAVMRGTLWTGMLGVAAVNLSRQQERVRLFEIGQSFHGSYEEPLEVSRIAGLAIGPAFDEQWGASSKPVDFFDIKSDVEALFGLTGRASAFTFQPVDHDALQPGQTASVELDGGRVGLIGKVHPTVAKAFDIRKDVFVFELSTAAAFHAPVAVATAVSRYPSIRRDIAIIVPEDIAVEGLKKAIFNAAPKLIRRVVIFDIYRGPGIEAGLKSVALGLILQETSRTLTDHDADSATQLVVRKLKQNFGAELRD
jgi:phenylalanyl-tRNA synthetase beta chain